MLIDIHQTDAMGNIFTLTVSSGGTLVVSSGGTALNITSETDATIVVSSGGSITYAQ